MEKVVTFYIKDFRGGVVDDFIKYLQQLGMRIILPHVNVCNKLLIQKGEAEIDIIFDEEKRGQWVSVKDELPEPCKAVLVYGKTGDMVNWRVDYITECGMWANSFTVTHWMPLPEPPKE